MPLSIRADRLGFDHYHIHTIKLECAEDKAQVSSEATTIQRFE